MPAAAVSLHLSLATLDSARAPAERNGPEAPAAPSLPRRRFREFRQQQNSERATIGPSLVRAHRTLRATAGTVSRWVARHSLRERPMRPVDSRSPA